MLQVNNIQFSYGDLPTLSNLNVTVAKGEYLAVIGESGSGKSTLLKLIYGEYDLNEGHIFWKDEEILGPKYNLVIGYDFMKYVSQEFDLEPYTSVAENIGMFLSNFYPEEKLARIQELLEVVELEDFASTKVRYLSGGQKQRVALARAMAKQPEILLLDEPFSHIDNFKKQSLRRNLFKYLKKHEIACIVATHDRDDALPFADTILALHDGKPIANGTPQALYKLPKHPLIAAFFGDYNVLEPYGIFYAHQCYMVPESELKAVVKHTYFMGHYYLIEAQTTEATSIYFEHPETLEIGRLVGLQIRKETHDKPKE